MRNTFIAAVAVGIGAFMLTTPGAGAAGELKLDNPGRLDYLELRTLVASTDGPVVHNIKADRASNAKLGLPGSPNGPDSAGLELLKRNISSAWNQVQAQAELAAKLLSKRTDREAASASRKAPELSWGWQHAS
jgi:hypothetical protein